MCLENAGKLMKASKDKTVYKLVVRTLFSKELVTSFQASLIHIGKEYYSDLISDNDGYISIGLHSFKKMEDADIMARGWGEIVVKCTIPKGAHYYAGEFLIIDGNGARKSYASDRIRYDEIVADYSIVRTC